MNTLTGTELRASAPALFAAADAAYDQDDRAWFYALPTSDLVVLWDSVSGENFIDMEGPWDDEVYDALAERNHPFG